MRMSRRRAGTLRFLLVGMLISIAGASLAEASRGWLGFGFTYPTTAERERQAGLIVQAVLAESPAAEGGLKRGDVISLIDGVPVSRHEEAAVLDFILSVEPGQEVALGILRGEERRTLQLVAVALPPQHLQGWLRLAEARDRLRAAKGSGGP